MRRLTHGRMDRSTRSVLGTRGQRVLWALVGSASVTVLGGACGSDPVPVDFGNEGVGGTEGGTVIPPTETGLIEQCGADGIQCGEGCCTNGNVCSKFLRCIPSVACDSNEDCSADSQCAAGGRCLPWDEFPEGRRNSNNCRTAVELPTVVPTVQCQWPGSTPPEEYPEYVQVIGTPMVVDFNSDDDPKTSHPSIVFISYTGVFSASTGVIRVIDGETCALQDTVLGEHLFTSRVPVALGDFNGDGRPDIIAADEEQVGAAVRSGIAAFELTGTGAVPKFKPMAKGRIQSSGTGTITGFAMHDIDGDDKPELFTEKTMLRYDDQQGLVNASALQGGDRPPLNMIEPPTVIDIDGDRFPEILTPQGVFSWDTQQLQIVDKSRGGGPPLWNSNADDVDGAFMAAANLADDWPTGLPQGKDSAELVVIGHDGAVRVKTIDGGTKFLMKTPGLAGGPPVIADVDGDGRMEFASGGRNNLTVFDLDCTPAFFNQAGCGGGRGQKSTDGVLWESPTQGTRSGVAMFDFNGDKKTEVVYADQCFMRVYDGVTGKVLFSTARVSSTQWEYPVVADTDGDGYSEIVTVSNDNDPNIICPDVDPMNDNEQVVFAPSHGITVWKEKDDRWAGSRPIWNQHNYFVTNVRDDGTIPPMTQVMSHWSNGGPNTFRQNVQGATGRSLSLADVTTAGAAKFTCKPDDGLATVEVDLCNRGAAPVRANEATIAMVNPLEPTRVLCQQRNSQAVDPGFCVEVSCDIPVVPRAPAFDVQILGDVLRQVSECNENNNVSVISHVSCDTAGVLR